MQLSCVSLLFAFISQVSAHGRITNITTSSGAVYTGWDPQSAQPSTPITAWKASNLGNIFVKPSEFNTSNITCHYNALPGSLHINTTAGDILTLQWNEWPTSHKGPVLTYLAPCGESCAGVDKTTLKWTKIDQLGWINSTGADTLKLGGTWGSDVLIKNGFNWHAKLPEQLVAGNYVLRHEIIALHVAEAADGAQAYPQCVNLRVANTKEAKSLDGDTTGDQLYGMEDAGILVDIHGKVTGYDIPGPKLWEHAAHFKQPTE